MILPPVPMIQSLELYAVTCATLGLQLRLFFRSAFAYKYVKYTLLSLLVTIGVAHAAWAIGPLNYTLSYDGVVVAVLLFPPLALATVSLPLTALVAWLVRLGTRTRRTAVEPAPSPRSDDHPPEPGRARNAIEPAPKSSVLSRRNTLVYAAGALPILAFGTGVRGLFGGFAETRLRRVTMPFANLPTSLEGLRVLQLSDLHLGCSKNLDDLESLLADIRTNERPDLVVLTGDVAEDVRLLAPALRMVSSVRPRLGVLSSLGNHEYLHDIRATRQIYDRSDVPLLVDRGLTLRLGDESLFVAGIDDPVTVSRDIGSFMQTHTDRALEESPKEAFRILLSHRPEGFVPASRHGVDLTLSGHTHAGQIGFNGKSAFEPLFPDGYLWGTYRRGTSRLYTSAGFGDWYPFRLGAPPEAPLVVLARE